MDLSFPHRRLRPSDAMPASLPIDLAVLFVGVAMRQATTPTAGVQAALTAAEVAPGTAYLAPVSGAFHAATAGWLRDWAAAA